MQGLHAANCALFIDLDGTLITIAATPGDAKAPADLVALLTRLTRSLDGALAVLTGRPVSDLDRILAPLKLVAGGVHGTELRTVPSGDVRCTIKPLEPEVVDAVSRVADIDPGIIVEPKGSAIAVHYRNAETARPQIEAALQKVVEHHAGRLVLCKGRKVIEVMASNASKGTALCDFMQLAPFRGRRPVMIGDDASDETALEAARRLGGIGLSVAGEHFAPDTADFPDPACVKAWLSTLA